METINNGMCRCCASEGTFKDVATRYQWMGEEEVYGEMLRECFDITLAASDDGQEAGICEVCITQLRNAANFKKQVQRTEEQFKRRLDDLPFKSNIVKVEASPLEEAVGVSDDDDKYSDEMSLSEYQEIAIKTESSDDTKAKKRSAKATTSRAKQPKLEAETSSKRRTEVTVTFERVLPTVDESEMAYKSFKYNQVQEIEKQRTNVRMLIQYSNATPIRCHGGIGYTCCFCSDQFPDPADLKTHTLENHEKAKSTFMKQKCMSNFLVKLDITGLQCTICYKNIPTVKELTQHLIKIHDKQFFTDVKCHILPFVFNSSELKCVECKQIFNRFKLLQEHMHTHYRNYICKVCDAGFTSRNRLSVHKGSHKTGTFPCSFCDSIFTTAQRRKMHERTVHIHAYFLNKCGYCEVKFRSSRQRDRHVLEVHGVGKSKYKCPMCDKAFTNRDTLRIHTKRDHLMERPFQCQLCEMDFFSGAQLKNHMLKHTGVREFQCDVCLKCFGRKNTLREHMRIHQDDRRFKCELCEQAFVQKCAWRNHMRSKHDVVIT
ncbi:PR domain zinc finger protein 5-like isoform X4 [Ostrinia furnacalis]|uniref:PR domain zinc finger protein 5-like isoform X4 n=1 Tax=Ostrinia furnacalis TaxID=93504 RepID=UPI001039C51D|nr:PR domain zinc finger protein 5-like isoform X4 [Ostrinia furnacalis]